MKKAEASGKTVETAIQNGLKSLGLERNQVDVKVLSEGGFLKLAKVELTQKLTDGEKALAFLEDLLEKMDFNFVVEMFEDENEVRINLIGTDSGSIIGYRGEVLDSLQYLTSLVINNDHDSFKRVVIDAEDYRNKREKTLEQLAKNLEKKVIRTHKYVKLEPMNPYERRIIHTALHDSTFVTTNSEGEEPNRYVVIALKKGDFFNRGQVQPTQSVSGENTPAPRTSLNFVYRSEKKKR